MFFIAATEETTIREIEDCERELAERTNVMGVVVNKFRFAPRGMAMPMVTVTGRSDADTPRRFAFRHARYITSVSERGSCRPRVFGPRQILLDVAPMSASSLLSPAPPPTRAALRSVGLPAYRVSQAFLGLSVALQAFRAKGLKVVLLTNAPRPSKFVMSSPTTPPPPPAYDLVVSSG